MQQRTELATFMNAELDELAFGQSTTLLLRSLGQALRRKMNGQSDTVVSLLDHEASATSWLALANSLGIEIKWWAPPPVDDPCLSLDTLQPLPTSNTRVVACNHVSNVVGTIHPIREIADLVHTIPGAVLMVDGVSYAPHRPIDVKALDVDFYCFSWYKVYCPHIAQLYGRREVQKRLIIHISHSFLRLATAHRNEHFRARNGTHSHNASYCICWMGQDHCPRNCTVGCSLVVPAPAS
jgi:selenocysteine lyase/cysteine desulfurase